MSITLRPAGAKLNGKPLDAAGVDLIAYGEWDGEPPADCVQLIEGIRAAAHRVVAAGLEGQLSLRHLSAFEVECLAEARAAERRYDRQALAALVGMALQQVMRGESPFALLPDGDEDGADADLIARRKGYAELMAAARASMKGVG